MTSSGRLNLLVQKQSEGAEMTAKPTVTRKPQHPGYTTLGSWNRPGEDYDLLVNGEAIGGTYWCGSGTVKNGQRWASYGPAGLSMGHRTREDAEQVQVNAHLGR
jgi:hypothetical protein